MIIVQDIFYFIFTIDVHYISCYHCGMKNKIVVEKKLDKKGKIVRLTFSEEAKVNHYLADNPKFSFQSLIVYLLDQKIGLK